MSRIVDVNIENCEYDDLLEFLGKHDSEILIDHELKNYHMMTIRVDNEEVAWDILARTFVKRNIDTEYGQEHSED